MTDRANQHFVPQFYFRHFSCDGSTIGTLLTRDGRTIPRASIKGQCARKNFYGSKELESIFSVLEGRQCTAIRAVLEIAHNPLSPDLTPEELGDFLQAITFQRSRTALEIEKSTPATEKWMLDGFKNYLQSRDDLENLDELVSLINSGNVRITEPPCATVSRPVSIALEETSRITDLQLCLLRNRTDYPFSLVMPLSFSITHIVEKYATEVFLD